MLREILNVRIFPFIKLYYVYNERDNLKKKTRMLVFLKIQEKIKENLKDKFFFSSLRTKSALYTDINCLIHIHKNCYKMFSTLDLEN